ncbi:MAG: PhzF family phenazine biosynthesis protein [Ginsengibacter sp.]
MNLTLYQIDAFTDRLFGGNPAAVISLDKWIDERLMQNIAMENNLSETVFFTPPSIEGDADFEIRWFTPSTEINLCGHATLASAFVLYEILKFDKPIITFSSQSGNLRITKTNDMLAMDFPSWEPELFNDPPLHLKNALGGADIIGLFKNRDLLAILPDEESVKNCDPDFNLVEKTGYKIIISAIGDEVDFVSRFFAPAAGVNEDPVTGSAHSQLIPFWGKKLNKSEMRAKQLSKRGGEIYCENRGDRVTIGGKCVYYMKGEIEIPGI